MMMTDDEKMLPVMLRRIGADDAEIVVQECPVCAALVAERASGPHERFHAQRLSA